MFITFCFRGVHLTYLYSNYEEFKIHRIQTLLKKSSDSIEMNMNQLDELHSQIANYVDLKKEFRLLTCQQTDVLKKVGVLNSMITVTHGHKTLFI